MTPKQIAIRKTILVLISGISAGIGVNLAFTYLTLTQIGFGFATLALVGLAKMVYDLELANAETQARHAETQARLRGDKE